MCWFHGRRWPQDFRPFLLSAPESADLMDPAAWTQTAALPFNDTWLRAIPPNETVPNRGPGGYLEGAVVRFNRRSAVCLLSLGLSRCGVLSGQ